MRLLGAPGWTPKGGVNLPSSFEHFLKVPGLLPSNFVFPWWLMALCVLPGARLSASFLFAQTSIITSGHFGWIFIIELWGLAHTVIPLSEVISHAFSSLQLVFHSFNYLLKSWILSLDGAQSIGIYLYGLAFSENFGFVLFQLFGCSRSFAFHMSFSISFLHSTKKKTRKPVGFLMGSHPTCRSTCRALIF